MEPIHTQRLYSNMIDSSRSLFDAKIFPAAHHALAAAMYIATHLEDSEKLHQVQSLAQEQYDALTLQQQEDASPQGTMVVNLYLSLIQMAKSRLMLFPRRN